jgi:hypothetical protein
MIKATTKPPAREMIRAIVSAVGRFQMPGIDLRARVDPGADGPAKRNRQRGETEPIVQQIALNTVNRLAQYSIVIFVDTADPPNQSAIHDSL